MCVDEECVYMYICICVNIKSIMKLVFSFLDYLYILFDLNVICMYINKYIFIICLRLLYSNIMIFRSKVLEALLYRGV